MSNMISELKDAGHNLIDEQKVQAVICLLPQNREHMKMHLTHKENIKTLEDVTIHSLRKIASWLARQMLMSTWLALAHMVENGASVIS